MNKESFRKLGIILNENIPTQELLAEDFNGEWKSPTRVTPEAQVPLTPESNLRMTPVKS